MNFFVSPLDSAAIQTSHNRTGQVWLAMASGLETNRESLARRLAYFHRAEYGCGRVLALMELVGEQLVLVQEDSSSDVESSTFASFDLGQGDEPAKASHYVDEIRSVGARRNAEHFTSIRKIENFVAYVICDTDRWTPTKPYPT